MKNIQNTIVGFTLTLAAAGMSFAAQAPAATPATPANPAPVAKKQVKKHTAKPAATTSAAKPADTTAKPAAK
jgi:hypothetical protein